MTLKGIQIAYDSITKRYFRAQGPKVKYFECYFLSFNK